MAERKRKRAPRGTLTPNKILAAALEIGDRDGLHSLTVRRLAASMGVSPMAIYGHFVSKAEIEKKLLGKVIFGFDVTKHSEARGRPWVLESFRRVREALLTHPCVIPLLGTSVSISQESIEVLEDLIAELTQLVSCEVQAAELFYSMLSFTVGSVHVEHGVRRVINGGEPEPSHEIYLELDSERTKTLLRTAPILRGQANEAQFMKVLTKLCP